MSRAKHALVRPRSQRITAGALAISLLSVMLSVGLVLSGPTAAGAADVSGAATVSKTVTRDNLVDGQDQIVDTRNFSVSLSATKNLRDRQGIDISWSGAHPTGGVVFNVNIDHAADQEYPVVILQCRGVDSTAVPLAQRVSQQTCFTQTPTTRYQGPFRGQFPPYRLDRYSSSTERQKTVGAPNPIPAACINGNGAQRWVPFVAADGSKYDGGYTGCGGLAPEQAILSSSLNPSNETFGTTDATGHGSARFIVQDDQDNASLGCSASVACSLVVIPIMGISCDAAAASVPAADQPPASERDADQKTCLQTGFYQPGQPNGDQSGSDPNSQVSVNGQLWWSASNWRNRISVPLTLAPTAASCGIGGGGAPTNIYGSEYMLQATQQWSPAFCSNPKLFRLQHTQTSEVQAKNLLATGVTNGKYLGVKAAFQAGPPQPAFTNKIVQAPTAISGFAIAYVMDDAKGHPYTQLKLDARLLAKLLTMSYPVLPAIRDDWATSTTYSEYRSASTNPLDMSVDPEFEALNPGMDSNSIKQLEASATLFVMSSDSDVMTALTSYINEDPDARAWIDGAPDPWGMVVNPSYKKISLPVTSWPLLDTYYNPLNNECIQDTKQPYLPLVAGQVADPAQITFNIEFGISASQTNCVVSGATDTKDNRRLVSTGAQQPGIRFLVGLVSLADAARYSLQTAALQTQKSPGAPDKFTDATGRSFASPDTSGLLAAARMMKPDDTLGTWPVPYHAMRTDAAGQDAYPGILLMSTDVPTIGLLPADATNFGKFLTYVAGPGQVSGTANGDLAGGYLPITAANGLSGMHDYTVAAADAVTQQRGFVPKPSDPKTQPVPTPSSSTPAAATSSTRSSSSPAPSTRSTQPTGTPTVTGNGGGGGTGNGNGTGSGTGYGNGDGNGDGLGGSPTAGQSTAPTSAAPSSSGPSSSPPPASSNSSPVAQAVPTVDTKPGWSSHALPALAIIALVSGAVAVWTSGLGRIR